MLRKLYLVLFLWRPPTLYAYKTTTPVGLKALDLLRNHYPFTLSYFSLSCFLIFFSYFLKYIGHITLSKFKVYSKHVDLIHLYTVL